MGLIIILIHLQVDTVCDAICKALEQQGADKFRLAILTTHVRKSEPELQKALEMVWSLRGVAQSGSCVIIISGFQREQGSENCANFPIDQDPVCQGQCVCLYLSFV